MGVKVKKELCTGCKGLEEPLCVKNCPGDLMMIGEDGKATIRNPEDCWDCMVCVKLCPYQALKTKLPYQLASYTASLIPELHRTKIVWKLKDLNEKEEVFELQTKNA